MQQANQVYCMNITQYGSTVYIGIAMVYPHWKPYSYKVFVHFHFQFEVDFTFNDIKVKNVSSSQGVLHCNISEYAMLNSVLEDL